MGTIMNIQENKFVVKWDTGEERFSSIESRKLFLTRICKITAPNKKYEVFEVVNPSM